MGLHMHKRLQYDNSDKCKASGVLGDDRIVYDKHLHSCVYIDIY